jgi:hypothetical protein
VLRREDTVNNGTKEPEEKVEREGVCEMRHLTRKLLAPTRRPGEVRWRRKSRWSAGTVAGNRRPCRQHRAPGLDSLQREVEDDETRLLVVVARLGAVGDGGSTVSGGGERWRCCGMVSHREEKGGKDGGGGRS